MAKLKVKVSTLTEQDLEAIRKHQYRIFMTKVCFWNNLYSVKHKGATLTAYTLDGLFEKYLNAVKC